MITTTGPGRIANEVPVRLRLAIGGAVQGVGFRPFVYRLATELRLVGWVNNSPQGVSVEVEGPRTTTEQFLLRLESEKPLRSSIQSLEITWLDRAGYGTFKILPSEGAGAKTAVVMPDIAMCADCQKEISDPHNRRYRYPFTNCTHCGPRFSILEALPYDRANTSMRGFMMCAECQTEYDDPRDRRYHAQPNACTACGPHLELWDGNGRRLDSHDNALRAAADAIRRGVIVAVKGLGGFHLIVAAHNDHAVRCLRERKHREEKPLALMFPTLESAREHCEVSPMEERLLCSAEAPIVLLRRTSEIVSSSVAPGNPHLGVMLPYTPLHHLLLTELGFPVVSTSGNLCDEPICTNECDALERLTGIADLFLVHNRPIVRHIDDSIVRVIAGCEQVLRRARGFAPLPIVVTEKLPSILAVGAHLKNTVALAVGRRVFVSQHIGDLETTPALEAFHRVTEDLPKLYEAHPTVIAADVHPDYLSTQWAEASEDRVVCVQHHYAHVLACIADNELTTPILGVAWDGAGYGLDGTIWGGEFLRVTHGGFERVVHFRTFRLPGGETAMREPRRAALGLLYELLGKDAFAQTRLATLNAFSKSELQTLRQMLVRGVNTPLTSSAGRLFDAVASLIGLRQVAGFEGQAALELEFLSSVDSCAVPPYELSLSDGVLDWAPMMHEILRDLEEQVSTAIIAAKFQSALVEGIVTVAHAVGEERIALTGGCFQNKYLSEHTVQRLYEEGFRPYWHQRVPPNDGGISLGQVMAASRALNLEKSSCA